jgi:hypothetical protein
MPAGRCRYRCAGAATSQHANSQARASTGDTAD